MNLNDPKKLLNELENQREELISHASRGNLFSRRSFLGSMGLGAAAFGLPMGCNPKEDAQKEKVVQGFDELTKDPDPSEGWAPFSDRKVRVGLVWWIVILLFIIRSKSARVWGPFSEAFLR